ncbi:MAG TPA: OmpA family protein [Polyangia bacterium]|jgi:OOP family OmpA-OmpF porin|nr:OmpA family protein [Polyangia bacterium]
MEYLSRTRAGVGARGASVALVFALALSSSLLVAPRPARADSGGSGMQVELGVTGGLHIFAKDLELGIVDDASLPSPKNSGLFGLRAALAFNSVLSVEIEGVGIPGGDRLHNYRLFIVGWRGHLLLHLLDGKLRPFVLAGAGALSVVDTVGTEYDEIKKDTDMAFHAGVGLKYALTPMFGLRIDARALAVPNTEDKKFSPDFEFMGGLTFTFGGREPSPTPPSLPPAPVVKDSDGDGIPDAVDKCPNEAEDKDGFEDDDGCPDLDNDKDGVPDAIDKCPNEAETKNDIDDADGCPEKDEDGDGILGTRDKCPNEAEDKDGFEDDDGCPDLDNDKDGVPDATDKCPNEAETKNGYQDEDGCPDVVPAAVARFTGVIKGITFRKGSAVLALSSMPTLKKALKVLKDYPELRIEISGHTSDDGGRERNMTLSRERADAAKAYFVKAGIDPGRIVTVGYGPDKPIADNKSKGGAEKNRRIEFRLISQDEATGSPSSPATPPVPAPGPAPTPAPALPPADKPPAGSGKPEPATTLP